MSKKNKPETIPVPPREPVAETEIPVAPIEGVTEPEPVVEAPPEMDVEPMTQAEPPAFDKPSGVCEHHHQAICEHIAALRADPFEHDQKEAVLSGLESAAKGLGQLVGMLKKDE